MGVNSLPKTVTRQRRDCDLNPGPSAPESSTLTTRLPSHPVIQYDCLTLILPLRLTTDHSAEKENAGQKWQSGDEHLETHRVRATAKLTATRHSCSDPTAVTSVGIKACSRHMNSTQLNSGSERAYSNGSVHSSRTGSAPNRPSFAAANHVVADASDQ